MIPDRQIVEVSFDTREQFTQALLPDVEGGGIFAAGGHPVSAGQPIEVMIRIRDVERGVLMRGTVLWRRVAPGVKAPVGIGVRFERSQRARYAFLRAIAQGVTATERQGERFPVQIPVAFVPAGHRTVRAGTLLDVSESGSLLHTVPAPSEELLVLRLRDGRAGPPLPAQVVWSQRDAAGLSLLGDRLEVRRFWSRVVEAARSDVDGRLLRGL